MVLALFQQWTRVIRIDQLPETYSACLQNAKIPAFFEKVYNSKESTAAEKTPNCKETN